MKKMLFIAAAALGLGIGAPAWLAANSQERATVDSTASVSAGLQSSRTDTPSDGVEELVYARRFRLETPYVSRWTKDRAGIERGHLVVIRVTSEYVYPHEAATPVLFVGARAVERINVGYQDGYVVGIVPGDESLETSPIYFGAPDYPERITAAKGLVELHDAQLRGHVARPDAELTRAKAIDAGTLIAADQTALFREAGRLIVRYAPAESDLGLELQAMP